jgi:hypothetical protein
MSFFEFESPAIPKATATIPNSAPSPQKQKRNRATIPVTKAAVAVLLAPLVDAADFGASG